MMSTGILSNKKPLAFLALLLVIAIGLALIYLTINNRLAVGVLIIIGLLGLIALLVTFFRPQAGVVICFLFCSFIFVGARIVGKEDIQYGVVRDLLIVVLFSGVVVQHLVVQRRLPIKPSPIVIAFVIFTTFLLVQFFNPAGSLIAWFAGMRGYLSSLLLYILFFGIFKDYNTIIRFTKLWLAIFFLAALYGFYQELVGLPPFDMEWVTANPQRIGLNFVAGRWRKWSFMSDVASFGLAMAFSGIFAIVMSTGPYSTRKRIILFVLGIVMLVAMVFSGTRTAYAIVPFGLVLFALLTLNHARTLWLTALCGTVIVVLIFGPFYGGNINRLRTAFFPSEDASMHIRDMNRARIQPYIHDHPIGGGFMTTGDNGIRYAPHHELAGFPPDSLYLETAMELGWIGLLIQIGFYFVVMIKGVSGYYAARNKRIKILYLAYTSSFFALTIAAFAKKAIAQIPLGIVLMALYVIMDRLIEFDDSKPQADHSQLRELDY